MLDKKLAGLLGLAAKAGAIKSGELSGEDAIRHGKACYVLIAADASENTVKKFSNMCCFHKVSFQIYGTKETLGQAIGRDWRSVICICDSSFANACAGKLKTAGEDK